MQAKVYTFTRRATKRPCAGCGRHPANHPDALCTRCRAMPSFARWFDQARGPA